MAYGSLLMEQSRLIWRVGIASSTGNVYDGYLTKDGISVEAYNGGSSINEISR